jgi:hypothetical protein
MFIPTAGFFRSVPIGNMLRSDQLYTDRLRKRVHAGFNRGGNSKRPGSQFNLLTGTNPFGCPVHCLEYATGYGSSPNGHKDYKS